MLPLPVLGIVGIGLYSFAEAGLSAFAAGLLVATGVFLVGTLFGFLFGIPKSLATDAATATQTAQTRRFKPNTNLEEISDWLTKIIVGLTLIQLDELIDQIQDLASFLAPSLGGDRQSTEGYAIAIVILFGISGFLIAYVATRLYVGPEFAKAEGPVAQAARVVRQPGLDEKIGGFVKGPA